MKEQHQSCENHSCGSMPHSEHMHDYMHKICGHCPCGCGSKHPCPMYMWHMSFYVAKREVMVEILKTKIQKAWGPKMEQTADLILQAMEAKKKGEGELKSKLQQLWETH